MAFETSFMVEWGDCDEAGIVFYPNYFYWLDCTFQRWLRSKGISQRDIRGRFGVNLPLMDAGCNFRRPVRYDDELWVQARAGVWEEMRFQVQYQLSVDGQAVASGHELRGWARSDADGRLVSVPIDPQFRALLDG